MRYFTVAVLVVALMTLACFTRDRLEAGRSCSEAALPTLPDVRIVSVSAETELVPHCKVAGVIGTETNFELLLPDAWNGKFAMGGGGGFVGLVVNFAAMKAGALEAGYASVGTDTGHQGHPLDGSWALHNQERVVSFGHQAVHRTAVAARALTTAYYGRDASRNYFIGCSTGGRQALMEAQRYPDDFDGIVAGAPAFDFTNEVARVVGLELEVSGGAIKGLVVDGLKQYHGIPYAAPPVGHLRWAPTAPVLPWQDVLDASRPGPNCPQRASVPVSFYERPEYPEQSEDCLTLNVWTEAVHAEERRPVMVWIHGGGLAAGAGSWQTGELLAGKGAVLVTFNYRLGRLGFLAHPELSAEHPNGVSGNQGFRDQIQALQWVRDNISKFGGDPDNVTIFGESAGGTSVSVMQASPLARGLFHRAIGQSGAGFHPMSHRTEDRAYAKSGEFVGLQFGAALVGEEDDQSLAALRKLPAQRIVEVTDSSPLFSVYEYLPTVDGEVLPQDVGTLFSKGQQADVPTLVGSNAHEGGAILGYFTQFMGTGVKGIRRFAQAWLPEVQDELDTHYPATTDAEAMTSWERLFTDVTFTYPMRAWARSMEPLKSPAYLYWFTWHPPVASRETARSFHGAFQMYLFGELESYGAVPTEADRVFASTLAETWVRFARTGDPNAAPLPEWPAFTSNNEAYMELGPTFRSGDYLRAPQLELIANAWAERRAANHAPVGSH